MTNRQAHRLIAFVAVALLGGRAYAQRSVDAELFRPSLDGYGILTVERAETAQQWGFGFKLFFNYATNPLRLAMYDAAAGAPRTTPLLERQMAVNLGAHLGFTNWLELAIDLPVSAQSYSAAYGQPGSSGDPTLTRSGFYAAPPFTNVPPPDAAALDARVALKARLVRSSSFGLALAAIATLPFGDDSAFLGEGGVTFRSMLIADVTRGPFTVAVNVGAVVRPETIVADPHDVSLGLAQPRVLLDVGDELTWSAGVAWRFARWGALATEAFGLVPLVHSASRPGDAGRDFTADVLGGLQLFPLRDISIATGAGAGVISSSLRHDDLRVFIGVAWAPASSGKGSVLSSTIDSDRDGVPDALDQCPDQAEDRDGFQDDDGCPDPDNDGDGIPDKLDRCPNEPEDRDSFQDDDGCPDVDNDGDGIPDAQDHCPNEPEDKDGFQDDDGCPDLDNDGDGIADALDRCPNEPETFNGIDDEDGCPDTGGAAAPAERLAIAEHIGFEHGHAEVPPLAKPLLNRIADRINAHREIVRIRIEGHADDVGSSRTNRQISQARAEAVRDYLIGRGVDANRLQAVGFGGERPIEGRKTDAARAKNRRVEFIVVESAR
jgi:outer membrane protein OmpA-like peptidoglycan-associated protein